MKIINQTFTLTMFSIFFSSCSPALAGTIDYGEYKQISRTKMRLEPVPIYRESRVTPFMGLSLGRFNGTQELNSAFTGGLEGGFELKGIALSLGASHIQQEMRSGLDPGGSVTLIPILVQIEGRIVPLKRILVRLGLGVGTVLSNFELSQAIKDENEWNTVERQEVDIKNDMAFQIKGGIERRLTDRTSVGFEIGYFIYETDLLTARVLKHPPTGNGVTRYEWTAPIDFNSVIGRAVLRFR